MRPEIRRILAWTAVLAGAGLLALVNRPLFLLINGWHAPLADRLFLSITHLGNGAVAGMLVLLVFPFRRDVSMRAVLAALFAGILASICKEIIASPRPPAVFGDQIHVVGKKLVGHSLPSGHTATAFGIAFSLRGVVTGRLFAGALAVAGLVGYSRVYIGAHFPLDVLLGAAAGWAGARVTAGPADRLLRKMDPAKMVVERILLVLALVAGVWVAVAEPMRPYNPVVLRVLGFGGAAAAAVLLARGLSGHRQEGGGG